VSTTGPPRHDVPAGGHSAFTLVDDRQVHYLWWGRVGAPSVVCLHGGGQTAVLSALAQEIGSETETRILAVNWWSYCSDVTLEVFGQDGGHGAENETAYIMAIDAALVQKELYKPEMATAMPPQNTWSAYPFPSTIMLYKEGQGYLKFDRAKAKTYFTKVNDKIAGLIEETIKKWEMAGL